MGIMVEFWIWLFGTKPKDETDIAISAFVDVLLLFACIMVVCLVPLKATFYSLLLIGGFLGLVYLHHKAMFKYYKNKYK